MLVTDLKPRGLWAFFDSLLQIPRPPKGEGKVREYILQFAADRRLAAKTDKCGNILILKPATTGCENLPTLVLQAHLDMICTKDEGLSHNFNSEGIETVVDGDWLRTHGTTMGADNGMGVALALALLDSQTVEHGALECLFTCRKEDGMRGAASLEEDFIAGKLLVNLDGTGENYLYNASVGCSETHARFACRMIPSHNRYFWFRLYADDLTGGEAGDALRAGGGNAIKIVSRFLRQLSPVSALRIASFEAGNCAGSIPRSAKIWAGTPLSRENVEKLFNAYAAALKDELKESDPSFRCRITSASRPETVMESAVSAQLLTALNACPQGISRVNSNPNNIPETFVNLGSVKIRKSGDIDVAVSQRSLSQTQLQYISEVVECIFDFAGAAVEQRNAFPVWQAIENSSWTAAAGNIWEDLYGKRKEVRATCNALECGFLQKKFPQSDIISCGPEICGAHTPAESIYIPSVARWWNFILQLLKRVPAI